MTTPRLAALARGPLPAWALGQRHLMAQMEAAAAPFVAHATRPDGTLVQRSVWTSMDGTDNGLEAFLSFPLLYQLGGGCALDRWARRAFDAITWQYADYGTVAREFVTGFDWFHHSESYTYLYYLALGDPTVHVDRARARCFAGFYIGDDPQAPNWDAEHRLLRSPLNGSCGPRFQTTTADWDYHRPILSRYLSPFEDLPGVVADDPRSGVDWTDPALWPAILERLNARLTRGDVPLNLSATSLVTHAWLYTGDDHYRRWVLDYLQAWVERRDANGGICPDNVGPTGRIGELQGGNWWGGYYGWRWPHGARNIVEPALVAGGCALLMTGDRAWLDLARSQLDLLWSLRRQIDGVVQVPARHGGRGWFDYRPPEPTPWIHLAYLSGLAEDRARLEAIFPERAGFAAFPGDWGAAKAGICPPRAWQAFQEGAFPDYPQAAVESTRQGVGRALARLADDDSDPETRECYHFQALNPVVPEALVQMAMGTPAALYNGGLLHAHLRYLDPQRRRPGLPEGVAALAAQVTGDALHLTLVNTDLVAPRTVWLQAGCFAEHEFTRARLEPEPADPATPGRAPTDPRHGAPAARDARAASPATGPGEGELAVHGPHLRVRLGPAATARLRLHLRRFAGQATYDLPDWDAGERNRS